MKKSLKLNALANAVRQSLSIIFPLITFPYASRVLGAQEYGKYTFAVSVVSYFILIASFGISNYAVREGSRVRDDSVKISKISSELYTIGLIMAGFSLLLLSVIVMLNGKIYSYKVFIIIQAISIILSAVGADWVNIIFEDFWYITIRYIIVQIIALVAIFLFVSSSEDTWKYCLILVVGSYGGNIINLFYIRKYVKLRICFGRNFNKYLLPLFILFLNSLATVIYVNSDITMLGYYVSDEQVGVYGLSSKIYNMIKHFINAILVVSVPRLANIKDEENQKYNTYIQNLFRILLIFLIPIVVGVYMLSEDIITIVGGESYLGGNISLKILSFSLFFALFASIYTNCILVINRKEKRCLIGTVVSAFLNVLLNVVLIPKIGIVGAAITTVIAEGINLFIQYLYARKELNIIPRIEKWVYGVAFLGTIIVIGVCFVVKNIYNTHTIINACINIMFSFVMCCLLYGTFLFAIKDKIKGICRF